MTNEMELDLKDLCNYAYKLAEDMSIKYASAKTVDDFETFLFLVYLHEINQQNINKLEARINELEQKEKAHNNA